MTTNSAWEMKDYVLLSGVIIFSLGLRWLASTWLRRRRDRRLARDAVRVTGTVVELFDHLTFTELDLGETRIGVEYEIAGHTYETVSQASGYHADDLVGETLDLLVSSSDPSEARLLRDMNSVSRITPCVFVTAIGLTLILVGL